MDKKQQQLGMPFGTAAHRLRQSILFMLVEKLGINQCYRCKAPILSANDISIDHKIDWLDNPKAKELFWDVGNIAFSHKKCNVSRVEKKRKIGPDGTAWCKGCKKFIPIETFYPDLKRWNKFSCRCKECSLKHSKNNAWYLRRTAERAAKRK